MLLEMEAEMWQEGILGWFECTPTTYFTEVFIYNTQLIESSGDAFVEIGRRNCRLWEFRR